MPSQREQVRVPPELDSRIPLPRERGIPMAQVNWGAVFRVGLSVLMIVLGSVGIGVGVGAWVHPGAGLAASSLIVVAVGVLLGLSSE